MTYVAIGSNLGGEWGGTPQQACLKAASEIGRLPGVEVVAVSRWYESAPQPPSDQPSYVNGVVRVRAPGMTPDALLRGLQSIEARAHRIRTIANAARTLDLDLVAMGTIVRDGTGAVGVGTVPADEAHVPDLVLPHPRAHLRAFVLMPIRDIDPDWVHPVMGISVSALIQALDPQPIVCLS